MLKAQMEDLIKQVPDASVQFEQGTSFRQNRGSRTQRCQQRQQKTRKDFAKEEVNAMSSLIKGIVQDEQFWC